MRKTFAFGIAAVAILGTVLARHELPNGKPAKPAYPTARVEDRTDVYHGVSVKDPYRWMEDLESAETKTWVKGQDDFGSSHLRSLPAYEKFKARILALTAYETVSPPRAAGGQLFYTRTPKGAQARAVIEVAPNETATARVLLDSNHWPSGETLAVVLPSHDGKRLAYGVRRNASNWFELRFLDVATGGTLPDVLRGLNSSANPGWSNDNAALYYSSFAIPEAGAQRTQKLENQKARVHRIGAAQEADAVLFESPEHPDWRFATRETEDGRFIVLTASQGATSKTAIYIREAGETGNNWTPVIPAGSESFTFRGNDGPIFWLQTDANAPRGRVIAVDIRNPARANWRDVIPQSKDTLNFVNLVDRRFVAVYVQDARHVIRVFAEDGSSSARFPSRIWEPHSPVSLARLQIATPIIRSTAQPMRRELPHFAWTRAPGTASLSVSPISPINRPTTRHARFFTPVKTAPACRCISPQDET